MSDRGANPRRRGFWKYLALVAFMGLLSLGLLAWYATTDSFQAMVRHRLAAELERITGGRVELGSIHTMPFRFVVDVRDLTIHGREAEGEVPYAHVDRLVAQVKLISVLGAEFGFDSLVLDHPVIHVIFYPDGTTNQPEPKLRTVSARTPLEQLFAASVGHLEVRHGEAIWNDQKVPLDFVADNVTASIDYSLLHRRYNGDLLVGKIDTKWDGFRPVAWMGEIHFELGADRLEVKSLRATSGRSHLTGSGRLINFRRPEVSGEYDLTLDLREAGLVSRHPEMRQGIVHATGRGTWSDPQFASDGTLLVKDLAWHVESLDLRAESLGAQFGVNPQQLKISDIKAKLLGGMVSGEAEVGNWLNPATSGTPNGQKVAERQKGSVRLRFKDLSAAEIAAALSSSARPLHRLKLAGLAAGTIETHWKGSLHDSETEIALTVVPPDRVPPGQLPLDVHADARYRAAAGELAVSEFNAATRATQVRASGTLSKQAAVRLAVSTLDLGEWEPALSALGYPERIPFSVRGRASFTGTATGRLSEIDFAGRLQSQDFQLVIPATGHTSQKRIQWDYLGAEIELSPRAFAAHNGTLRRDGTDLSFDLDFGLDNRKFTDSSRFTASLQMHNADVGDLLALAGRDYPVRGKVDLFLHASGTGAQPQGHGRLQLSEAMLYGGPVQQFEAGFSFNREQVSLQEVHFRRDGAQVTGDGTYNFSTKVFQLNLHGNNFELARIPALQFSRVAVEGRMDFDAQSSGTLDEPVIDAKIRLHDLSFDHELAGDFALDAMTQGAELRLSGHSQFHNATLDIDGNVHLRDQWPATVNLHFNRLDVDPVLRTYLKGHLTGHSEATGDLQLLGPLRDPGELQVKGDLSEFLAEAEHIQVRNNGPIRFAVSDRALNIQQLRLIGQGTDLIVAGTAQLTGEHRLDLRANGHADLELLHSLNPDFTSSGTVTIDVALGGTADRPVSQGRLQISHGSIQYSDLPSGLSDINGSLIFNQDRLQIETLTAHVGGGNVSFGGYATAYNRQLNFDLTLRGQDVRLRYPPGVSSMTNADLHWAGTSTASTLSGNATITKLAVTPGFDFASYLQRSAQSSTLPQTNPLLNRIRLDVHIVTTPELQMQTAVVRLSGGADLQLRGTTAKPVLLGRADVIEGEVYFNGTKYRMERGQVTFINPVTTTPVLDLQASTRVRDYDVTVNLNGQFDKLNLSYHSEPPLPTADIISLLALGQTQEQSAQLQQSGQSPFVQQASSAVLAEALNSAMSNRAQRLFGISHIKINPQGISSETTPTQTTPLPAVTIEQQVRDNLTLTYTTNVAQTSQQIIQGEYNITKNLSIVGIRDYNGVVSFEVRIRQRKK